MYSDRQNTAWIVARAAQLVADSETTDVVNKAIVAQIKEEFIPNPDVPNDLIDATVKNLGERVSEIV